MVRTVIVRKEHTCSAVGCDQPILKGQPAVTIRVKTLTAAGEEWRTNYYHLPCREAKTGEKIEPPTHQPYLFKGGF